MWNHAVALNPSDIDFPEADLDDNWTVWPQDIVPALIMKFLVVVGSLWVFGYCCRCIHPLQVDRSPEIWSRRVENQGPSLKKSILRMIRVSAWMIVAIVVRWPVARWNVADICYSASMGFIEVVTNGLWNLDQLRQRTKRRAISRWYTREKIDH